MAKRTDIESIVIEDELPLAVAANPELPGEVKMAVNEQKANHPPSLDNVAAYWSAGREPMEAKALMNDHRVKCAKDDCAAMLHYIPVAGEDAPMLICEGH